MKEDAPIVTVDRVVLLAIVCPPLQCFWCLIRLSGRNVLPQFEQASSALVLYDAKAASLYDCILLSEAFRVEPIDISLNYAGASGNALR